MLLLQTKNGKRKRSHMQIKSELKGWRTSDNMSIPIWAFVIVQLIHYCVFLSLATPPEINIILKMMRSPKSLELCVAFSAMNTINLLMFPPNIELWNLFCTELEIIQMHIHVLTCQLGWSAKSNSKREMHWNLKLPTYLVDVSFNLVHLSCFPGHKDRVLCLCLDYQKPFAPAADFSSSLS